MWGDPPQGAPTSRWFLTAELAPTEARTYELDVSRLPLSLLEPSQGRRVMVTGTPATRPAPDATRTLDVSSLDALDAPRAAGPAAPVIGSQPWATLLCGFPDVPNVPHPVTYYEGLMGTNPDELDHYWQELSYGRTDLGGSAVFGWYELPEPKDSYATTQDHYDLGKLANDCASQAEPDVFFPNFVGINVMLNSTIGCCAWGGHSAVVVEGESVVYMMTWLPPWAQGHGVAAHEMGHGFGLPHSSGPYGQTYDSQWDVMSGRGVCRRSHPDYGCRPVHTISYHKYQAGWIDEQRVFRPALGTTTQLTLEPLSQSATGGYSMAVLPSSTSARYTVEARRFDGYDTSVPLEGLVIHQGSDFDPLLVVDPDDNGDVNDQGAAWVPGEAFIDHEAGVIVIVDGSTPDGYDLTIYHDTQLPTRALQVIVDGDGEGTVVSDPAGIACQSASDPPGSGDCDEVYTLGSSIALTAIPNDTGEVKSRLASWTGGCEETPTTCQLYLTDDRTVTVTFEVIPPSISFSDSDAQRFTGIKDLPDPEPAIIDVTNSGGSPLTDLSVHTSVESGAPDWIDARLEGPEAPTVLNIRPRISVLTAGSHTGEVAVLSETATNSPRTLSVVVTVSEAVSQNELIRALAGEVELPVAAVEYLDSNANGNGGLDVGDFLWWLDTRSAQ